MPPALFEIGLRLQSSASIGKPLSIGVEVRNTTNEPVWIVGVLDGSEVGIRYPHYLPEIGGPGCPPAAPEWPDMTAPLRPGDFRLLQAGEAFDPTRRAEGAAYLPLVAFQSFVPEVAGEYRFRLMLSTESSDPRQWLGTLPDAAQAGLVAKVLQVPRCRVYSDTLIVTLA